MSTRTSIKRGSAIAAAAAMAFTMAACGGSDEGNDESASADTIKVMAYGPIDAKGFSFPGIETAARAGVEKVNEAGGINGRDLELIVCNDNNDPNTAAGCARQAIQEKVVAVVGAFSAFESSIVPVLEEAGIPIVGGVSLSEFSASNIYTVAGGAPASLFGLGKYLASDPLCDGRVGAVIEDIAAVQGAVPLFQLAVSVAGGTDTGISAAPANATDFGPAVAAAADKAPCLMALSGPQTAGSVVSAIASNGGVTAFGTSEGAIPNSVIQELKDAAEGMLVFSTFLPLNDTTDTPEMKEFLAAGRAIDSKFEGDQVSASAYLGPQILQRALEGTTSEELTSADIVSALDAFKGYDTGLGPIVDFTTKNPTKAFARMPYAAPTYRWVVKDGVYTLADEEPVFLSDVYDAASQAGQ